MMTDARLLDIIDALTKSTVTHIKQTTDDGEYLRTVSIEHPALLQQLADSVVPSAGNDGGSKSASARERNVLDSDALWELTRIETQLRDWLRGDLSAFDRRDLPASLRRWYVAYAAVQQPYELDQWHVRELSRWRNIIESRLDRSVKQIPTGYLCVHCGTQQWIDAEGERQPARLILSYRKDEDGRTSEERVTCQRCRTGWDSIAAIEELGEELTEVSERMRA